jgi:hypothetical protein
VGNCESVSQDYGKGGEEQTLYGEEKTRKLLNLYPLPDITEAFVMRSWISIKFIEILYHSICCSGLTGSLRS